MWNCLECGSKYVCSCKSSSSSIGSSIYKKPDYTPRKEPRPTFRPMGASPVMRAPAGYMFMR